MSFIEYGSQKTDTPKTPTLRQWCKQNPDREIHCSQVIVIFKPSQYASWTFITEAGFKVAVERDTPLEAYLNANLAEALDNSACIYIQIKSKEKGSWAFSSLEGSLTDWEEHGWGYKAGVTTAKKPDSKKNQPNRNKSGADLVA